MSLLGFCEWLAETRGSIALHESLYMYPLVESAHVLTLTTKFPNGVKMTVHGIFTYTVNDDGKIKALRGFWSMAEAKIDKPA